MTEVALATISGLLAATVPIEPLAKLSIDSGRRKNTEVIILGGA